MEMDDQIVECVPNFSEGRNTKVIEAIADAIRKHKNLALVDIDSGVSTNRTVYTIVGRPNDVMDSIISAAKVAYQLIDMSQHKGEHKRLGALDVVPFIPIVNLTMQQCADFARTTAKRLSDIIGCPTYLYGYAATVDYRRTVPSIRQGEYEALEQKLKDQNWQPDFGSNEYTPVVRRFGATMCGARKILLAYNINLMATKEQANKIAFDIREQGRGQDQPGVFKDVQAMGWTLEERNISQITINILDYELTPLVQIWEEVNRRAKKYCLPVCGSEVVGVLPLKAILDVADFYIKSENLLLLEEDSKIQFVISRLGLSFLNEFKPKEKIIEFILKEQDTDKKLFDHSLKEFTNELRNRNPIPGGGSVAALAASLSASLVVMVGRISSGKRKFEQNDDLVKQVLPEYYEAADRFLKYVDLDSEAYFKIVTANRLPESTMKDAARKQDYYRMAILNAIEVPHKLMAEVVVLINNLKRLCPIVNLNALSDLQVAITFFRAAVYGAYYNVIINLENLSWNDELKQKVVLNQNLNILADAEHKRTQADVSERELHEALVSLNRKEE